MGQKDRAINTEKMPDKVVLSRAGSAGAFAGRLRGGLQHPRTLPQRMGREKRWGGADGPTVFGRTASTPFPNETCPAAISQPGWNQALRRQSLPPQHLISGYTGMVPFRMAGHCAPRGRMERHRPPTTVASREWKRRTPMRPDFPLHPTGSSGDLSPECPQRAPNLPLCNRRVWPPRPSATSTALGRKGRQTSPCGPP